MPNIQCSATVAIPTHSSFVILKNGEDPPLPANDKVFVCTKKRILKPHTFKHVMDLARAYVPQCDMWFYNNIEAAQHQSKTGVAENAAVSDYSKYSDYEFDNKK